MNCHLTRDSKPPSKKRFRELIINALSLQLPVDEQEDSVMTPLKSDRKCTQSRKAEEEAKDTALSKFGYLTRAKPNHLSLKVVGEPATADTAEAALAMSKQQLTTPTLTALPPPTNRTIDYGPKSQTVSYVKLSKNPSVTAVQSICCGSQQGARPVLPQRQSGTMAYIASCFQIIQTGPPKKQGKEHFLKSLSKLKVERWTMD